MHDVATLHRGTAPLLLSLPHDGSAIPDALAVRMTEGARAAPDTDWHVARLYAFARELGASVLVPAYSRYVVDLNRPPRRRVAVPRPEHHRPVPGGALLR